MDSAAPSVLSKISAALNLPQGESYQRLYTFIPAWIGGSLLLVALGVVGWVLLRPRIPAAWNLGTARLNGPAAAAGLAVFCAALVLACDGVGLAHGFFRQDDFSFLQVTRETEGLGRQMLLIHSDHLLPLYRLEMWLVTGAAGPDATTTALANWFRAGTFVSCVGLLLAGSWLLHELGVARLGLLAFAFFLWMWPGWGEFTGGYFSCTAYIQILALGLGATAAMLRGFNRSSAGWLAVSLLLATLAAGIDISGAHVFLTLAILAGLRNWPLTGSARPARYLVILGAVFLSVGLFYFLVSRQGHTPREFVQNPQGSSLKLATLVDNLRQHPLTIGLTALAAPGGLLLGLVTPTFLQLAVVNDRVDITLFRGFLAVELLLLAGLGFVAWKVWQRLLAKDRFVAGALLANAAISLGMVIAARVDVAGNVPIPLWQARYLLIPITWFMLALAFVGDRLWVSRPLALPTKIPRLLYAAGVAGVWLTVSCWQLEKTLLPQPLSYVARGRWGNLDNSRERARQYQAVLADLADIARQQGRTDILLPPPERWAATFFARYPILEWGGEYTPRGVTYLFWDLPAASPHLHLTGQWATPETMPASSREFLSRYAWLREMAAPAGPSSPPDKILRDSVSF